MPGCEASLSVTDAIKKRVSVREDADPFSVSGKKLELASLVSGGRLLSLFSGLVCLPGFRSRRAGGRSLAGKLLYGQMRVLGGHDVNGILGESGPGPELAFRFPGEAGIRKRCGRCRFLSGRVLGRLSALRSLSGEVWGFSAAWAAEAV